MNVHFPTEDENNNRKGDILHETGREIYIFNKCGEYLVVRATIYFSVCAFLCRITYLHVCSSSTAHYYP
jgi:hypothetical protein